MVTGALIGTLIGITIVVVALSLQAAAKKPVRVDETTGDAILEFPLVLRVLCLACAIFFAITACVVLLVVPLRSIGEIVLLAGVGLFFILLGDAFFLVMTKARVALSQEGIRSHFLWRQPRIIRWNEIGEVSFSPANAWFIVTGAGKKIRVHSMLIGIQRFVDLIKVHVPPERYANALKGFEVVERRAPAARDLHSSSS